MYTDVGNARPGPGADDLGKSIRILHMLSAKKGFQCTSTGSTAGIYLTAPALDYAKLFPIFSLIGRFFSLSYPLW